MLTNMISLSSSEDTYWDRSLTSSTFLDLPKLHFGLDFHSQTFGNMLGASTSPNIPERKAVVGRLQMPCSSQKQKLCEVCGNTGATSHYGGTVCGGCKIFFSRTVQSRKGFVCERDGQCPMNAGKRAKCRACRFQLCLRAHMSPEEVGRLRDLRMGDYQPIVKKEGSVVGYFDEHSQPSTSLGECQNQVVSFIDVYSYGNDELAVLKIFVNLETSCENNGALKFADKFPKRCNASFDLSSAIAFPMPICEKIPMDYMREKILEEPRNHLKLFWCRNVLHFLEWTSASEDLGQFSDQEKTLLIAENFLSITCLSTFFGFLRIQREKFEQNPEDVSPPCAPEWFFEVSQLSSECVNFAQKIINEILEPMDSLDVTIEEMVLLKFIMLFNDPTTRITAEKKKIQSFRLKYCDLLRKYIKNQVPDSEKRLERISELLKIVEAVRNLAGFLDNWMTMFYTSNTCDLNEMLVYDFHVRIWNSHISAINMGLSTNHVQIKREI